MFDDDIRKIFERMRKIFDKDIFDFANEFLGMPEPEKGEKDNGDEREDGEGDIDINKAIHVKDENRKNGFPQGLSRSFSISYKFGTGMDHPEIHVSGDIPPEKIQEFLNTLQGAKDFPAERFKNLKSFSTEQSIDEDEPIIDVYEEDDEIFVVMEMPGVKKEDITIMAAPNEIEVNGRVIKLPTEIDVNQAVSRLKNGILQIRLKKKKEQSMPKKRLDVIQDIDDEQ